MISCCHGLAAEQGCIAAPEACHAPPDRQAAPVGRAAQLPVVPADPVGALERVVPALVEPAVAAVQSAVAWLPVPTAVRHVPSGVNSRTTAAAAHLVGLPLLAGLHVLAAAARA